MSIRTLQTPNPVQSTANVTVPTCSGSSNGKIDALVTGGNYPYTYLWDNGSTDSSLTQIASGNYSLVVTDNMQCSDTLVVYVGEPDSLSASVSVTNETCHNSADGSVTVQIIGGTSPYLYIWSNQQQTQNIQNLVHGNYMVTVTDANGCQTLIVAIVENPEPIVLSAEVTPTPCIGTNKGGIDLLVTGGSPNYTYSWSNGEITESITQIGEGNYQVSVSDVNSCSATAVYTIVSLYELQVSVTPPLTIEWAEQAILNATTNVNYGNTYTWTPRESLDCSTCSNVVASPTTTTDYQVEVVDSNGCKAIAQTVVNVNASHVLFLPNVFTPNNDGVNDYLQLYGDKDAIEFLQFSVFNRWGEKVYETNNHNFSWDGFYKSAEGTTGVYSYFMKVVFNNGESRNDIKGTITLLR